MAKTLTNAIQVREFCALRDEVEREKEQWTTRNAIGLVSYNMVHQYSTCSFKRTLTLSWQFIFISVLNVKLDLQTPEYKVQELSVQSLGPGSDIPSATCMHHAQSAVHTGRVRISQHKASSDSGTQEDTIKTVSWDAGAAVRSRMM